ncbi:restriction endonuclease subunit S [Mycobacteroides abscessus]|uniref:restriction endonuclease subunit S n=1 Tax=Mycobacteroides abscessus TaxID=36809 RepID=UPI00266DB581|nr:restriction endonuclease subunit S [Mycobacteroides abscessus]MDO3175901.1 restriction endonuclease subunit S [Mycobacteroides abscessus subsp. abscessus]
MTSQAEHRPLGQLLRRPPRYGINAAAVPLAPGIAAYIRITDIDESGRFSPNPKVGVDHPSAANYKLSRGELVFARTGASVGKSYLYDPRDGELVYAGFLINIAPDPNRLNPKYLSLFAQTKEYWDWIVRTSVRSGQPGVNGREYAQLPLPLPDIATQNAIASAVTDVDELIVTLERLIAKKQAIKQGMMQQLLTGKTRLPGFSKPWREVRLGDHVTYVKTVALSRAQLDTASPLRYLHYGDIHTRSAIRVAAATEAMPRAAKHLVGSAGHLRIGDVVFADASEDPDGVGKSVEIASVPNEGVVAGLHTIAARFDKTVLADGFKAYLQFIPSFRESLLRLAAGTKVLATTRSFISSVTLPLPSVDEQRAISRALTDCDDEVDILCARLIKARAIKHGMLQELLTGRTRLPVEEVAS